MDSPKRIETHVTMTEFDTAQWTADGLQKMVLELNPQVAVFDCDGTLWDGDSGLGFMTWSMEQGLVSRSTSDWIDTRHRAYRAGAISEVQICGEMVQIYAGLRETELREAASRYVSEFVLPRIFPEIDRLVRALRGAGAELWVVSSTNKWVITEGVRAFEIPETRVLAAEAAVVDGTITSTLVDVPTDDGKASALKRVGLSRPAAVFGNSIHDLPMLELAENAFPINPSPALREAATRRGWGWFRPAGVVGMLSDTVGK